MTKLRIAIGSDHGGYEMKQDIIQFLLENNYECSDVGNYNGESVDYPLVAQKLAKEVISGEFDRGILLCGSGLGMAIAANKVKDIKAVTCHDTYSAKMSRTHNNANVLTLGARVIGIELAKDIVKIWLESEFEGGRHQRRVDLIE